ARPRLSYMGDDHTQFRELPADPIQQNRIAVFQLALARIGCGLMPEEWHSQAFTERVNTPGLLAPGIEPAVDRGDLEAVQAELPDRIFKLPRRVDAERIDAGQTLCAPRKTLYVVGCKLVRDMQLEPLELHRHDDKLVADLGDVLLVQLRRARPP